MDRAEAEEMYKRLASEHDEIEAQVVKLTERRDALRQVLTGLARLYPEVIEPEPSTSPRPKTIGDGLERVFREVHQHQEDRWISTGFLVKVLKQREWLGDSADPDAAVRAALRRLLDRGVIVRRHSDGRAFQYKLRTPDDNPDDNSMFLTADDHALVTVDQLREGQAVP